MSDEKNATKSRRQLLKSLAAGGGAVIAGKSLPENWSRPVVDAVSLPAHAQTSVVTFSVTQLSQLDESDSMFANIMDALLPNAHAIPATRTISYCVTPTGPDTANFNALINFDGITLSSYSATNIKVGEEKSMTGEITCVHADAGDWLDSLGLIHKAEASIPQASVLLTSIVLPVATGIFTVIGEGLQQGFNASPGSCSQPNCPPAAR